MAINKQKKKEIVEKAGEMIKNSESLVFVNFKGLKMNDTTAMRKELKKSGISYRVLKKTLLDRAIKEAKIEGEMPKLPGEIAVVSGGDSIAPAREIYSFQNKFKDSISIVGGIFERKFKAKEEMLSIAKIPGLQVLRGQFVNLINSPIQRFAVILNAIAEKKG